MAWKDLGLSKSQLEEYERLQHQTGLIGDELQALWIAIQSEVQPALFDQHDCYPNGTRVHPQFVLKAK
jgi:hypothetical protein